MGKNTSIVLGNHFENFISSVISSGSYSSVSEVIRAGLRILEENEMEKQLLLKELKKGEESGYDENFDKHNFLKEIKEKYAKK
jgi:antitoxin ParD1/3/4